MPSNKFLFVNHTGPPTTSSKARSSEQAEVLSHVQTRRRRPVEWSTYTSTLRATEKSERRNASSSSSVGGSLHASSANVTQDVGQQTPSSSLIPPLLPREFPRHNSTDPFNSTSVNEDAGLHKLLYCTINVATRPNFLAEAFAPPILAMSRAACRHEAMLLTRLQLCVHDETLMYASLAYGSCFLNWMLNKDASTKSPEYFLDRAIASLRRRLASPDLVIDDWVIMSMYSLAITQLWNGHPLLWIANEKRHATSLKSSRECLSAAEKHLGALFQFVEAAGGWQRFDPYVLDSVILGDKFLATILNRAPIMPLTWDPGHLSAERLSNLGLDHGSGMCLLGLGDTLLAACTDEKLKQTVSDIVSYINVAPLLWTQPSVEAEDEHWLFRRFQALCCHVQVLAFSCDKIEDRCISLAIAIFLFSSTGGTGPRSAARLTAVQLESLIEENWDVVQGLGKETLLWCYYVAVMTPGHFDGRQWFINRIVQSEVPVRSEAEILSLFRDHLLVPIATKESIRGLRQELQSIREA